MEDNLGHQAASVAYALQRYQLLCRYNDALHKQPKPLGWQGKTSGRAL